MLQIRCGETCPFLHASVCIVCFPETVFPSSLPKPAHTHTQSWPTCYGLKLTRARTRHSFNAHLTLLKIHVVNCCRLHLRIQ